MGNSHPVSVKTFALCDCSFTVVHLREIRLSALLNDDTPADPHAGGRGHGALRRVTHRVDSFPLFSGPSAMRPGPKLSSKEFHQSIVRT